MKIQKIEVEKLFGEFDYEIPLNEKDRITIIHGPNGSGKTILLTLVNAFLNSDFYKFREIPFKSFKLYFDNQTVFNLYKEDLELKKKGNSDKAISLNLEISEPGLNEIKIPINLINPEDFSFPLAMINNVIPELEQIDFNTWIFFPTGEKLSLEQVLERFRDKLPFQFKLKNKLAFEHTKSIGERLKNTTVHFIETQRLLRVSPKRNRNDIMGRNQIMTPVVSEYSKELVEKIQFKLAEYGALSQSLDRSFPARLVKVKSSQVQTSEVLQTELQELETKRSRLIAAGLLDQEKGIDDKDIQRIDDSNRGVLSVYISDVREKLSVFDELTEKIDLMVNIINSRFAHKTLSISKKEGFVFKTHNGEVLSPTNLSSGEQHELVLLYEMLFKVKPDTLIMIDEPELSLHVGWQINFLEDLQKITQHAKFDVLIATHSPQIINDRWDLTVELKGSDK